MTEWKPIFSEFVGTAWNSPALQHVFSLLFSFFFFCVHWRLHLLNELTYYFQGYWSCNNYMWHCKQKKKQGVDHTSSSCVCVAGGRGVLKHGCFSIYSMFTYQSDSNYTSDGRILVYTTWQGGTQPKFCLGLKGTNLPGAYVRVCRCRGC